jgi:hypothetical protein
LTALASGLRSLLLFWPALIRRRTRLLRFPTSLLPSRPITRREIQEHRFQVRLDGGEFEDVQTLVGQQPANDCKIKLVVVETDLEKPSGERLHRKAGPREYIRSP